ncbi:hypothetical protein REPUB_Repub14bG0074600 [Reevesia pubescens]
MFVNVSPGICLICLLNRVMTQSGFFFFAHSTRNTPTTIDSIGLLRLVIGKQQSTKSKNPKAKEKSKNKEIIMGSNGNIINNKKKAVIVSVVTATADNYGKVSSSITSSAKTESPQEIKKMKNKKKNNKKHKVQVSNTKKPLIFYLNLAKRYISECNEVELCGLGMGKILWSLIFFVLVLSIFSSVFLCKLNPLIESSCYQSCLTTTWVPDINLG